MYMTCGNGALQSPVQHLPFAVVQQRCVSAKEAAIKTLNQFAVIGGDRIMIMMMMMMTTMMIIMMIIIIIIIIIIIVIIIITII